jgi:outer membrane lipoprotein-sorting protein
MMSKVFRVWVMVAVMAVACRAADAGAPAFRAIVKTITTVSLPTGEKTVESLSSIAVKGGKYRLQTYKPGAQIYICDGEKTVAVDPVTNVRKTMALSAQNQPQQQMQLLQCLPAETDGDFSVDTTWGLPDNIKTVRLKQNTSWKMPSRVDLLDAYGKTTGTIEIKSAQPLGTAYVPTSIIYQSQTPAVRIEITYSDLQEDPDMPDEVFSIQPWP